MRQSTGIVMCLVAGLFLALSAGDKADEKQPRTVEERVTKLFAKWDDPASPGAAVAVVRDGMVVYRNGFGSAQLEYNVPITPSTVFHVASVSKQFPAFAVTLLEEEGRLSVDDDIRKYLPWMPDFGPRITIRHLLNHTSGIRDQWDLLVLSGWRMDDVISQKDILYLLKRQRELNFKPGEEYLYSNSGFTLLTEIVVAVTGRPFVDWMDEKVFKPLGMNASHFHLDHRRIVKNRAYSYRYDSGKGLVKSVLNYANVGATSLFTTVEDMANWMRNYSEMRVGNGAVMARMMEPAVLNSGRPVEYGRGLGVGEYRGLKHIGHGGADAGFRSAVSYYPEEKFGVVVLANLAQFNTGQLARQIAEIYLADRFKTAPASPVPEARKPIRLSKKQLRPLTGAYWISRSRLLRTVALEGNDLFYVRSAADKSPLVPYADGAFFMKDHPEVKVHFHADGKIFSRMELTIGDEKIVGDRVDPFAPTPQSLEEYAGTYESDELDVRYRFVVDGKDLVLDFKKQPDENRLQPLIRDVFATPDGYVTLGFERDDGGRIIGFRVDTGRVRGLRFVRVSGSTAR